MTAGWARRIARMNAALSFGETRTDAPLDSTSMRSSDNAGEDRKSRLARNAVTVAKGIFFRSKRHRTASVSLLTTYDVLRQFQIKSAGPAPKNMTIHHLAASIAGTAMKPLKRSTPAITTKYHVSTL